MDGEERRGWGGYLLRADVMLGKQTERPRQWIGKQRHVIEKVCWRIKPIHWVMLQIIIEAGLLQAHHVASFSTPETDGQSKPS